jgi:hypothetical protein
MPNYQVSFYKDLLSANGHPFHCLQQRFLIEDAPSSAAAVATAKRRFELMHHAANWRCNADVADVVELPDRAGRSEAAGAAPERMPSLPGSAVVLSFLPPGTVFDPIQVVAMCKAYDKACARLHLENRSGALREALAAIIVSVASTGNCDCEYLCDTTLERIARGG